MQTRKAMSNHYPVHPSSLKSCTLLHHSLEFMRKHFDPLQIQGLPLEYILAVNISYQSFVLTF